MILLLFLDLAGSTSNQTTICVMMIIFSLSPLPRCVFHIRNKADLTEKLDTDQTNKRSLSIFIQPTLRSTNITRYPIHCFLDIQNTPFNFEELILKVALTEQNILEDRIKDIEGFENTTIERINQRTQSIQPGPEKTKKDMTSSSEVRRHTHWESRDDLFQITSETGLWQETTRET